MFLVKFLSMLVLITLVSINVASEGWANFVAGATYWSGSSQVPRYGNLSSRELEGDTKAGNYGYTRRCVRHGSVNGPDVEERYIGNVTRFFWDLYDSTTTDDTSPYGHTDAISTSLAAIADTWIYFPSGTGNHENDEAGDDGRNVRDYSHWHGYRFSSSAISLIYVNCLEDQLP